MNQLFTEHRSAAEQAAEAHWNAKRYDTSREWHELKKEERTKAIRHMTAALIAIGVEP